MKISFVLNGQPMTVETDPARRVIDLLREDFGFTGAKEACGTGECGACTILVDGKSRLSCLMLVPQLEGRTITAITGMEKEEPDLSDIQESFVAHGAVQCGFCTPGMVLAVSDLLNREPTPDRTRIREAISGNLCRCTGYQKIVDAVEAVVMKRSRFPGAQGHGNLRTSIASIEGEAPSGFACGGGDVSPFNGVTL